ncbi:hypothetical protein A4S05_04525 [Nostoc sp. KVJ20]|uniref:hypothetical protein n=1 Tax=unclassified Nostoc TaxID=2593658 RepID=UPI00083DD39F|nr:hypothetical protein [Nostoc sp. KVJ20]ODG99522.1 hypothetical protein A4S05_04525 [Nostoc sp. KVJ20]
MTRVQKKMRMEEVGVPPTEPEREFEGFQSWIEEKYGINSGQSWSKIILFYSVDEPERMFEKSSCRYQKF